MDYKNLVDNNGFYLLNTNIDKLFKEAMFGYALYERIDGDTYKHAGICETFEDAYKWLKGEEIKIIKIYN